MLAAFKKLFLILFLPLLIIPFSFPYFFNPVFAICEDWEEGDNISTLKLKAEECQKERSPLIGAHETNKEDLAELESNVNKTKNLILKIGTEVSNLNKEILNQESNLGHQEEILAARIRSYYKKSRLYSPFLIFLASSTANDLFRELSYRKTAADNDKEIINEISKNLKKLDSDREELKKNKEWLDLAKSKLEKEAFTLEVEVEKVESYFTEISNKIAGLNARQQQLINQRQAGLNLPTSLGAGSLICTDDRNLDPGFSPGFAFYTYGIPHRVGMNQYGAYGRAKAGQSHEQILQAYFNADFSNWANIQIKVKGYGQMPLETYLLGIYEIPGSWPMEALKAQAIAARSYAIAYTNNGQNEICTDQGCQVYKGGNKGGDWEQAVNQTAGKVLLNGGQVITAWYSSTDGGYTHISGEVWGNNKVWTKNLRDTEGDVSSFADLNSKSYDRDSPCFYAAQGWRSQYGNSAWLKSSEVSDIVNVLMLAKADSSIIDHLYQTDKPHPYGGEVWDENRVKNELKNRNIASFDGVSNASVNWDSSSGRTTNITLSGDGGAKTFTGDEFKGYFNVRAPANIQIVGPLYNVEKR